MSYLVDSRDNEIQREVLPYRIQRDILVIGTGSTQFRLVTKGNSLSLTVAKSAAGEDIGRTMKFQRTPTLIPKGLQRLTMRCSQRLRVSR